jgi:Ser/Thr protein kinase RdoA (MazF antagonist)
VADHIAARRALATLLWSLLLRSPSVEVTEEIPPLWQAFVTGYRSVRTISPEDFDAIGLLVAIRHIWLMGNHASRVPHWGAGFMSRDWFHRNLGHVRKWEGLVAPAVD